MKKNGRSKDTSEEKLQARLLGIELGFKEEIEENSLFLAASLTYFFGVLLACLTEVVERGFGIILVLTAIMIVWYVRDGRKEIRRKYDRLIETLLKGEEHKA